VSWLSFRSHVPFAAAPGPAAPDALRSVGAAGEMLSLSASLCAREDVPELEIEVSALSRDDGTVLPGSAVDVYVVAVWEQAGVGVYQSAPQRVAELLLKDDRVALRDGWRHGCRHWRHPWRRGRFYTPPSVRLRGPARTSLAAGAAKQIWISVRIPPHTAAGCYRGRLVARAAGRAALELPVHVEVVPLQLVTPPHDAFLWYRATLDCRRPRNWVDERTMAAHFDDIAAHGFRSVSLTEAEPALLRRAVELARAAGLDRQLVLCAPFPRTWPIAAFGDVTPVYYLSDEADVRGAAALQAHVRNWQEAQQRGVRTMCALTQEAFSRRFLPGGDVGHAPDVFLYYLPRNRTYFAARASFAAARERPAYYYWHSHMEKPLVHRVLAGVYLWKSGADGIAPYCYQDLPEPPNSPFDDFDEWDSGERAVSGGHALKDHMTTYPARAGSIPTLQWKGLSAGLFDLAYLATLDALLRRAGERGGAAADAARAAQVDVDQFLAAVSLTHIQIDSDSETEPYPHLGAEDFAAFRERLARAAVEIQGLLE
jgi:hypothetical protein